MFHKPLQAQTQRGWWPFPLRTVTVAVTARRIGEAGNRAERWNPSVFTRVRKSDVRARRVGCEEGTGCQTGRLSERGEGTWRKVSSGWEDPFLELSSHSPIPKQPVGVCSLLLSGSSWGHSPGQDFHSSASMFSFKVMNSSRMDIPIFTV